MTNRSAALDVPRILYVFVLILTAAAAFVAGATTQAAVHVDADRARVERLTRLQVERDSALDVAAASQRIARLALDARRVATPAVPAAVARRDSVAAVPVPPASCGVVASPCLSEF